MKLKSKIACLSSFSSLLSTAAFSTLILLQQSRLTPEIRGADILSTLFWWELGLGLIILCLTTAVAWIIARKFTTPIVKIASVAREIANGDLSSSVDSIKILSQTKGATPSDNAFDETGNLLAAMATMTDNLNSLIGQVQRSGVQVSTASSKLSSTVHQYESMLTNQINSMHQAHKSVEKIAEIAAHLVDTMHQAASMSQETADFANSSQNDLIRMKATMSLMKNASKLISERLEAINEKAEKITSVVTTINKVAEQTNLLSLNAAIEAEKAGEYGRGFAVIAREIRNLADQTAVATLDIEDMVHKMQSAVTSGVMEMDKFIAEVQHGVGDVSRISEQLTNIITQVQTLSPNLEKVNLAMGDQSQNAQKINSEIVYLGKDMEHTMVALRDSYLAIEQLNDAAQGLQQEVSRFQVSFSLLRGIEIFQPFSDEAKSFLNQHMQGHHYASGETIIRQGDCTDSFYVIASGAVGVWVKLQDGESLEVARLGAGDFFGEMALLTGEPRTASVITVTDTYLFEIKKEHIAPFLESEPEIVTRLSAILTARKLDTEAKRSQHTAQELDKEAIYTQTLHSIQRFFGLASFDATRQHNPCQNGVQNPHSESSNPKR